MTRRPLALTGPIAVLMFAFMPQAFAPCLSLAAPNPPEAVRAAATVAEEAEPRNPFLRKISVIAETPEETPPAQALPDERLFEEENAEGAPLPEGKPDGEGKKRFADWTDPLQRRSVDEMHVAGVIAAKHMQIAAVRFASDAFLFVKPGAVIGTEKYKVVAVSVDGVTLKKNNAKLTFPVSNPSPRDVYEKPASSVEKKR